MPIGYGLHRQASFRNSDTSCALLVKRVFKPIPPMSIRNKLQHNIRSLTRLAPTIKCSASSSGPACQVLRHSTYTRISASAPVLQLPGTSRNSQRRVEGTHNRRVLGCGSNPCGCNFGFPVVVRRSFWFGALRAPSPPKTEPGEAQTTPKRRPNIRNYSHMD